MERSNVAFLNRVGYGQFKKRSGLNTLGDVKLAELKARVDYRMKLRRCIGNKDLLKMEEAAAFSKKLLRWS